MKKCCVLRAYAGLYLERLSLKNILIISNSAWMNILRRKCPWLFQNFYDWSVFHDFSRPGNDHFKIPWLFQVFHDRTNPDYYRKYLRTRTVCTSLSKRNPAGCISQNSRLLFQRGVNEIIRQNRVLLNSYSLTRPSPRCLLHRVLKNTESSTWITAAALTCWRTSFCSYFSVSGTCHRPKRKRWSRCCGWRVSV